MAEIGTGSGETIVHANTTPQGKNRKQVDYLHGLPRFKYNIWLLSVVILGDSRARLRVNAHSDSAARRLVGRLANRQIDFIGAAIGWRFVNDKSQSLGRRLDFQCGWFARCMRNS